MLAFPEIDLSDVLVPWSEVLSIRLEPVREQALADAENRHYSQLGVANVNGQGIGLIPLDRARESFRTARVVTEGDVLLVPMIPLRVKLDSLLGVFEAQECALVCAREVAAESHPATIGLLTRSDLNKHPIRAAMYPIFAELEWVLAKVIEHFYTDPWSWLRKLDIDKQARLVGYWELSKLAGVDVGPISGTTLSELLRVIGSTEDLRKGMQFESRKQWDNCCGIIAEVRNAVMHPVRPLIMSASAVREIAEALRHALVLLEQARLLASTGFVSCRNSTSL